ncbi:MAG: DUF2254 domain-containing protein [Acidobacteriota bacterium]|nr:DUF2254 domain-containing protein [Acidobacteriota bacterium]
MNRIKQIWTSLRESLWFLPAVMVAAAIFLAVVLIEIDVIFDHEWLSSYPRIFGAGADGSRGMLASIAGSMITVAGLTFSLTIVAMSQVASQYTSRVLRTFMRDRRNQFVLGFFVGIFAYCLVVLRTIRGGDEGRFIPSLAVFFGLLLAVASVAVLIFFIHHIANSIQAATIIERAAQETTAAVKRLFPKELGEEAVSSTAEILDAFKDFNWQIIESPKTGFVQDISADALLEFAKNQDCIVRMERGIGDFVNRAAPLAAVNAELGKKARDELLDTFSIGTYRTIDKDAAFGVRQLVDIALKALSPGINDTTTAVLCVNYLGAVLFELANRGVENPVRKDEQNRIRVLARGATFGSLLDEAFDQIRDAASNNPAIYLQMLSAIESIAGQTKNEQRRRALNKHINLIAKEAARTIESEYNREQVRGRVLELTLKMSDFQNSDIVNAEKD